MTSICRAAFASLTIALLLVAGCGRPNGTQQAAAPTADSAPTGPASAGVIAQAEPGPTRSAAKDPAADPQTDQTADSARLVLAGGCFWCMEVAFEQLKGVTDVVSGYAGGAADTADYKTVSTGLTGHAEAVRITYDPKVISESTLLRVFFTAAHDPTQVDGQGHDIGPQYRSTIFYTTNEQQQRARQMIDQLNESGDFDEKIATTLEPLKAFYPAEVFHQDYVKFHPQDRYVMANSLPTTAKVCKLFPELIRE